MSLSSSVLISTAGVWVLCQLFAGELLPRLGIAGDPTPGTLTLTGAQLKNPGEDGRDRRDVAKPPSPVPSYGGNH